ncbi:hypothetical protein RB594_000232 [Gaeumannomyces avenae]
MANYYNTPDHSGLQVVPQQNEGLQVVAGHGIEVDTSRTTQPWDQPTAKDGKLLAQERGGSGIDAPAAPTTPPSTICGLRKRTFYLVVGILGFVTIAAAVGGGVGGSIAARNASQPSQQSPAPTSRPKTSPVLQESALAALNWRGSSNDMHYQVYFQSKDGSIMESAWDPEGKRWTVSRITDPGADVKPGTPLGASASFPHVNTTWDVVKNVYFSGSAAIIERQSPFKEQRGVWGNDNLSGQYSSSTRSRIVAFWDQNFDNRSQTLMLQYQTLGANSLSVSKYVSDRTSDLPWATQQLSLSILDGSPIALARIGNPTTRSDTRLYLANSDENMVQYQFDFQTGTLGRTSSTAFKLSPQSPLAVIARDNTGFYSRDTLPACARAAPYTHLVLFASPDRSPSRSCRGTAPAASPSRPPRSSPCCSSAAAPAGPTWAWRRRSPTGWSTQRRPRAGYVLFDAGDGPEVEEWEAPAGGTDAAWKVVGSVSVK